MLIHEVVLVNDVLRDQAGCHLVVLMIRHRVYGHEGGGSPCDLPGYAQSVQRLGQIQVTGDPGGIRSGPQVPLTPPKVLGATIYGGGVEGGLQRTLIRRERGVMQGDPLLPTIFNVVVDVVVRQWESLVAERDGGDISNNDDAEQLAGRIIREINNRR